MIFFFFVVVEGTTVAFYFVLPINFFEFLIQMLFSSFSITTYDVGTSVHSIGFLLVCYLNDNLTLELNVSKTSHA